MPNETIVAVFETSAQAERAAHALVAAGVPEDAIERHNKQSGGAEQSRPESGPPGGTGFFFWDMMFGMQSGHQDGFVSSRASKVFLGRRCGPRIGVRRLREFRGPRPRDRGDAVACDRRRHVGDGRIGHAENSGAHRILDRTAVRPRLP